MYPVKYPLLQRLLYVCVATISCIQAVAQSPQPALSARPDSPSPSDPSARQVSSVQTAPSVQAAPSIQSASSLRQVPAPGTLLINGDRLVAWKQKAAAGDEQAQGLVNSLRKDAEKLLDMAPVSVMDKPTIPPSGDKHDYMSLAPYFWYDSSKPNGLPYMRRDGERNPEIYRITDHTNMSKLESVARKLALAWWFSGDEKYAGKAAQLLRYWFFDEATRMNPRLEYAQAVPGVNNGRGTGIIESNALTGIADAAILLQGSASWTEADRKALQGWYSRYLAWMLDSKNGKDEHAAKNNHGTWYLAQAVDYALFTGQREKAKELSEEGKRKMDGQIGPDGKMPLELARTNGLGYSTYNLQAWFNLATLATRTGVDLWHYRNLQGAGIRTALDWLRPYATGEQPWGYQQIGAFKRGDYNALLLRAASAYGEPGYNSYLQDQKETELQTLLY